MDNLQNFFTAAKNVRLSPGERSTIFSAISGSATHSADREPESVRHTHAVDNAFKTAQGVILSPQEKQEAFQRVFRHMRYIPAPGVQTSLSERITSFFALHRMTAAMAAFTLLISATGSLAYAAESAMPTDSLYTFKIAINEPLISLFTLSDEAQVRWQMERVKRRFSEAQHVAGQKAIDPGVSIRLQHRLEKAIAAAEQRLAALEQKQSIVAEGVVEDYRQVLESQSRALQKLVHNEGMTEAEINQVFEEVMESQSRVRSVHRAVQAEKESSRSSEADRRAMAEAALEVYVQDVGLLEAEWLAAAVVSDEENSVRMHARMSDAESSLANARLHVSTRQYDEALQEISRGHSAIDDVRTLLRLRSRRMERLNTPDIGAQILRSSKHSSAAKPHADSASVSSVDPPVAEVIPEVVEDPVDPLLQKEQKVKDKEKKEKILPDVVPDL